MTRQHCHLADIWLRLVCGARVYRFSAATDGGVEGHTACSTGSSRSKGKALRQARARNPSAYYAQRRSTSAARRRPSTCRPRRTRRTACRAPASWSPLTTSPPSSCSTTRWWPTTRRTRRSGGTPATSRPSGACVGRWGHGHGANGNVVFEEDCETEVSNQTCCVAALWLVFG